MDDTNKTQDQVAKSNLAQDEEIKSASTSNVAGADVPEVNIDEAASDAVEPKTPAAEEKTEEIEVPVKVEEIEAVEEEGKTEETAEPKAEPEPTVGEAEPEEVKPHSPSDDAKWYIVHTYSGHENKVSKNLKQRIESMGFENRIFDIIVPVRDTVKVSGGKKENVKEKIFPGYVLVKMILDDESWLLVRTTQGVTAFIGAGNKPTPISDKEVQAIQKFMATEEPLYKTAFSVGEAVKITDGPFTDFLGAIDNIDEAKGKLKVLVSIFGRETPVELDFLQVSKL
jgi:transcriptional antiterminator NusG